VTEGERHVMLPRRRSSDLPGVDPTMRVLHAGRELEIVAGLEADGTRRELQLVCKEFVEEGGGGGGEPDGLHKGGQARNTASTARSEEHTSELQSREKLVCR